MFDASQAQDQSVCSVLFLPNQQDFFLFGSPIFSGMYTTHNMDKATITFVPHSLSTKSPVKAGVLPTQELAIGSGESNIWSYVIGALFASAMGFVYIQWLHPIVLDWFPDPSDEYLVYIIAGVYTAAVGLLWFFVLDPLVSDALSNSRGSIHSVEQAKQVRMMVAIIYFSVAFLVFKFTFGTSISERKAKAAANKVKSTDSEKKELI